MEENSAAYRTLIPLIIIVSITGTLTLAVTFLVMRKSDVYKTPYGVMMQARCLYSILFLLYYLLFVALLDWNRICPEVNKWAAWASVFFSTGVFITNAVVSLLRFVNVNYPFTGDKKYRKCSKYVNLLIMIMAGAYTFIYSLDGCGFYFIAEELAFHFSPTPCGWNLTLYGDFFFSLLLFNLAFLFDITTVMKLRKNRHKLVGRISSFQKRRRLRKEISLSVQTLLYTALCSLMVGSYHLLPKIVVPSPFLSSFLSSRLLWCLVVASGGYFSIVFDKEVKKFVRTRIFFCKATRRVTQGQPTASPAAISAENQSAP